MGLSDDGGSAHIRWTWCIWSKSCYRLAGRRDVSGQCSQEESCVLELACAVDGNDLYDASNALIYGKIPAQLGGCIANVCSATCPSFLSLFA